MAKKIQVLREAHFTKWFVGGKNNASENCIDRHLDGPKKIKRQSFGRVGWRGRTLTYAQLQKSMKFSNVLKKQGIKKRISHHLYAHGSEAAIAMLAYARIGAVHSVVFGGFSATSILDRLKTLANRHHHCRWWLGEQNCL